MNQRGAVMKAEFGHDSAAVGFDRLRRQTELAGNRADYPADLARHTLCDAWYLERTPDLSRITVPVLSAGNWGGPGLHLRGNIEGFLGVASKHKWLSLHTGTHWESFYLPQYVALQKRFFDWALKGLDNGWGLGNRPRRSLHLRHHRCGCPRQYCLRGSRHHGERQRR